VRPRCTTHESGDSEPILSGPAHAVAAIRLSAPPAEGPAIVALLCDHDHRLLLAITVEDAPATGARRVVDLVLSVAESAGVTGIVVGIVRERLGRYLSKAEVAGLGGLVARCEAAGVDLLDVVLVGPRGWRSIYDLADEPVGGEDGPR
jgi:hypothetical protein